MRNQANVSLTSLKINIYSYLYNSALNCTYSFHRYEKNSAFRCHPYRSIRLRNWLFLYVFSIWEFNAFLVVLFPKLLSFRCFKVLIFFEWILLNKYILESFCKKYNGHVSFELTSKYRYPIIWFAVQKPVGFAAFRLKLQIEYGLR